MGTVFIELEDVVVYISEEQIKGFKYYSKLTKQGDNSDPEFSVSLAPRFIHITEPCSTV